MKEKREVVALQQEAARLRADKDSYRDQVEALQARVREVEAEQLRVGEEATGGGRRDPSSPPAAPKWGRLRGAGGQGVESVHTHTPGGTAR